MRKTSYGESDLIIQFLSDRGCVVSGFAAGAQRSKKRFSHQFHIAGIYKIEWTESASTQKLSRIRTCELVQFIPGLSENFEAMNRWMTVLEWISMDPMGNFNFDEIEGLMKSLSQEEGHGHYYRFFIQQIERHGLVPELGLCVVCQKGLGEHMRFSLHEGGLAHSTCSSGPSLGGEALKHQKGQTLD